MNHLEITIVTFYVIVEASTRFTKRIVAFSESHVFQKIIIKTATTPRRLDHSSTSLGTEGLIN
jgi:hypothetical protein